MKVELKEGGFEPIVLEVTIETQEELSALKAHFVEVSAYDYEEAGVDSDKATFLTNFVDTIYRAAPSA